MKAWTVEIAGDPDQGQAVVFANTRNEARSFAGSYDLIYDRWIDVEARRFKSMDNKEGLDRPHLMLELWREHGWRWWDIEYPDQDEATDEQFLTWYKETFGEKK